MDNCNRKGMGTEPLIKMLNKPPITIDPKNEQLGFFIGEQNGNIKKSITFSKFKPFVPINSSSIIVGRTEVGMAITLKARIGSRR